MYQSDGSQSTWKYHDHEIQPFRCINPASILYKSTAGRYRPVSYPDGPITARCRFIKNAYWEKKERWGTNNDKQTPYMKPPTHKEELQPRNRLGTVIMKIGRGLKLVLFGTKLYP